MNFTGKSLARTLKDAACQVFLNTLDKIDGAKDLVLSKAILVQLDSICGMQKLRQNAVDKVFKFEAEQVISDARNRVYVIRPSVEDIRSIAKHIEAYLNQDDDKIGVRFWIIFIPGYYHYCDIALEEEGIYEYVSVLECPLGLLPLEYDLYSLEDESIFKILYLNKDTTPLNIIVNSIMQLQLLSGNIIDVHGQGQFAKVVADKLDQANLTSPPIRPERLAPDTDDSRIFQEFKRGNEEQPSFTDLYLIDRNCDFASLLLSQLNYEGILDESFQLSCNKLEFKSSAPDKGENNLVKHSLTSDSDPIYRDIRDNHFSTVFSMLKTKNYEMKDRYNKSQGMNLSNLKNFVANELKTLQAEFKCLGLHISACEEIMRERNKYDFGDQLRIEQNIIDGVEIRKCLDYITKMIVHRLNAQIPLRLLSLLSLTQGGLPPKDYQKFHSLYCENYGLSCNVLFSNLKKMGLLTEMNLSLHALTGGLLSYGGNTSTNMSKSTTIPSSLSLASFTGAVSSLTERASGRVAAAVSSSVLPRRGNLSAMLKKFQLVPEIGDAGYNIREPKDPAFVFGGAYIPLICQLIDQTVLMPTNKKNTQPIMTSAELMKLLPGPNFKRKQAFLNDGLKNHQTSVNSSREKSLLIYFIGGVTYAEVTALRYLAKKRNVKIAIAATSILNGNKLVDCLSAGTSPQSNSTKLNM